MNRVPGACRHTWMFSRAMSAAGSSRSSTSVRIIASSSAINSAAGLPLPATSPTARDEPAVAERQDLVEVAADRVRGPAQAGDVRAGRAKRPGGSIAFWISRAISRSFLSDRRSATSSSTSRFTSANAKAATSVPLAQRDAGNADADAPDAAAPMPARTA